MSMKPTQRVRFIKTSRYNDWQKGDLGCVTDVLALRPKNQTDLYIVHVDRAEHFVWATSDEVEAFDQMPLF